MRELVNTVDERTAYILLHPIAKTGKHSVLLDEIFQGYVDKLRTDNYDHGQFCNSSHVYLRYFSQLGSGFHQQMAPFKDEKGHIRYFDSYKLEYTPFNVVRN